MAKISNWNPQKYDSEFLDASMDRLRRAAKVIAGDVRERCPVGTISRPMYVEGMYAGKSWTRRDAGALKRTIRVVEKHEDFSHEIHRDRNVRVYAGNYNVYYAQIVEYNVRRFMHQGLNAGKARVRAILEG